MGIHAHSTIIVKKIVPNKKVDVGIHPSQPHTYAIASLTCVPGVGNDVGVVLVEATFHHSCLLLFGPHFYYHLFASFFV